jgi:hypothetical protein
MTTAENREELKQGGQDEQDICLLKSRFQFYSKVYYLKPFILYILSILF